MNQTFYDLQADGDFWGKLEEEWYNLARYPHMRFSVLKHLSTIVKFPNYNCFPSVSTVYVVCVYRENIDDHPWLAEYTAEKVCTICLDDECLYGTGISFLQKK